MTLSKPDSNDGWLSQQNINTSTALAMIILSASFKVSWTQRDWWYYRKAALINCLYFSQRQGRDHSWREKQNYLRYSASYYSIEVHTYHKATWGISLSKAMIYTKANEAWEIKTYATWRNQAYGACYAVIFVATAISISEILPFFLSRTSVFNLQDRRRPNCFADRFIAGIGNLRSKAEA